ncbi:MAG: hypothetical protein AWU57_551 [Marinobacter sp. T13-3]|nr:MAG: hypothetical protein AWU57_551 [Marinobacter sp. T13-3]
MYVLDIEASSLGRDSYPIEIAWCRLDGGDAFSTLINPDSAGGWEDWDTFAETEVHGLSRAQCCQDGQNVVLVVRQVEDVLTNHPVCSDAHWQDQFWLERLFEAVGKRPPAKLMDIRDAVSLSQRPALDQLLKDLARPHRAKDDCQVLCEAVRQVRAAG